MAFSMLFSLLFSTIVIVVVEGRDNNTDSKFKVIEVGTVRLKPMPYPYRKSAIASSLLSWDLNGRRKNCTSLLSEIKISVLLGNIEDTYVPPAHWYEIDGEDVFAIRCPSLPAVYLSTGFISENKYGFIARIVSPPIDQYKFSFEIANRVNDIRGKYDYIPGISGAEDNIIITMDVQTRISLCAEAAKYVRFSSTWNNQTSFLPPHYYEFTYYDQAYEQMYVAFPCNMIVINGCKGLYIRSDSSKASNMLTIVLEMYEGGYWVRGELDAEASVNKFVP